MLTETLSIATSRNTTSGQDLLQDTFFPSSVDVPGLGPCVPASELWPLALRSVVGSDLARDELIVRRLSGREAGGDLPEIDQGKRASMFLGEAWRSWRFLLCRETDDHTYDSIQPERDGDGRIINEPDWAHLADSPPTLLVTEANYIKLTDWAANLSREAWEGMTANAQSDAEALATEIATKTRIDLLMAVCLFIHNGDLASASVEYVTLVGSMSLGLPNPFGPATPFYPLDNLEMQSKFTSRDQRSFCDMMADHNVGTLGVRRAGDDGAQQLENQWSVMQIATDFDGLLCGVIPRGVDSTYFDQIRITRIELLAALTNHTNLKRSDLQPMTEAVPIQSAENCSFVKKDWGVRPTSDQARICNYFDTVGGIPDMAPRDLAPLLKGALGKDFDSRAISRAKKLYAEKTGC